MSVASWEPGSTIGVFGGGQLGRMFAHAAQRMGYHVKVFSPERDGPAAQAADISFVAEYEDVDAVARFARQVDIITLEFENIPLIAVETAEQFVPVAPGRHVLEVAQHRIREKTTLQQMGFPVTPFAVIDRLEDLKTAGDRLGWPLVLKTATSGYDGKGQQLVRTLEAAVAVNGVGMVPYIAEKKIDFQAEISILAARNQRGQVQVYPLFQNVHAHHILDVTQCRAFDEHGATELNWAAEADEIARGALTSLDCIGLLCIEFFVGSDDRLMINEIAPRPHNSGHLTMEACATSQFEQQLRAVCNMPLGETRLKRPAAMVNLLGDLWSDQVPKFDRALEQPDCWLHLYGKSDAKPKRKMGHITCLAQSSDEAAKVALRVRQRLTEP